MSGISDTRLSLVKYSTGGGRKYTWILKRGGSGCKIQAIDNSHYFIVLQVALLGVSNNCVKKTQMYTLYPCTYTF